MFTLHSSISVTSNWLRISCALKSSQTRSKIFSQNEKGFRDGLAYFTPQRSRETKGNAITHPRSHPIPKLYILIIEWDRGLVMAFPYFEGWNITGHT